MKKYLEIDCNKLELNLVNGEIVIKIVAQVRANFSNRQGGEVKVINQGVLSSKSQQYATMFKHKVVRPPPPSIEEQPVVQTQGREENKSELPLFSRGNTDNTTNNRQNTTTNPANIFEQKKDVKVINPGASIFGRATQQRDQMGGERRDQRRDERRDGNSNLGRWENNIFSAGQHSSQSNSPSFMGGGGGNRGNQDSYNNARGNFSSNSNTGNVFFSNPPPSSNNNNNAPSLFHDNSGVSNAESRGPRRPPKDKKTRIT